jgi:hypothetical protein
MIVYSSDGTEVDIPVDAWSPIRLKNKIVDWKDGECQVCKSTTTFDWKDGYYHCGECGVVLDAHKLRTTSQLEQGVS